MTSFSSPPSPPSPSARTRFREYFAPKRQQWRPGERKLVCKIDFFILTFCCLSYFVNYLDRTNLANAYVSGMKEELRFQGDQLNQINTVFTIGYVLGQIPSNLCLQYVRPRRFFPGMMLAWAVLTMATAGARSPGSIMAIRLFQGAAEATTFVGTHYVLGSWYTPRELGKRSGVFTASGLAGTMVGGFLQTGIHAALDGRAGISGWRWMFLIDGVITLPVALYGLLLFPDTPETTTAFYLSERERELAVARAAEARGAEPDSGDSRGSRTLTQRRPPEQVPDPKSPDPDNDKRESPSRIPASPEGYKRRDVPPHHPAPEQSGPESTPNSTSDPNFKSKEIWTWTFARQVLTSWEWWGFVVLWIIAGETESLSSNALLALYLKASGGYTVAQLNNYPTGVPAVGILSTLFWSALTDALGGKRDLVGYLVSVVGISTGAIILASSRTPVVLAAYYLAGSVYACQAVFFAWANDAMRPRPPAFRAVVLAGMNLGSNAVNAWWSILFYGASMAPRFERGMYAMIATSVALAIWTGGLSYVERTARRRAVAVTPSEQPSSDEPDRKNEVV